MAHATAPICRPFQGLDHEFVSVFLGLLTAFGRRDAPSPASGRWPAIPDLVHKSLPAAGSRPRLIICRSSAALCFLQTSPARQVRLNGPNHHRDTENTEKGTEEYS